MARSVSVIVLAYGEEPDLGQCVESLFASQGVDVHVVLVDNGCTSDAVTRLAGTPRLTVVTPSHNLGFAGGVNLGVRQATGDVLALVNSDAWVEPQTLAGLAAHLDDPTVGLAGGLLALADKPTEVNSIGNPLHILGLSWAGHFGEPRARFTEVREVASASGGCLAVRRETWDKLGGFPTEFFAYFEDLELAWRTWQLGLRVIVDPALVAYHHYEFSRSTLKMYLLERNRLLFLRTCMSRRYRIALGLPLAAFEAAMLLVAATQGWAGAKVKGWWWIVRHRRWVRARARAVQSARVRTDRDLAYLMADRFDSGYMPLPQAAAPLEKLLAAYWRLVRRWI